MYNVGDKVVYPMHGAGIIEAIEEREVLGEKRQYYIMAMPIGDMRVMIPLDAVEEIGLRQVIAKEEAGDVMEVLKGQKTTSSTGPAEPRQHGKDQKRRCVFGCRWKNLTRSRKACPPESGRC